jgi:hypothetical protein
MESITPSDARAALDTVQRSRGSVRDEVGLPAWYWWGVALGWVVLGVIADLGHPWLTTAATLVVGAVHSTVAPRVVNGRNRSSQLSVRGDVAGRHLAAVVLGGLVALAALTVVVALILDADGARHPVTSTSVFVAVLVLLGGPQAVRAWR